MKIEIAESLIYSWLKHIKGCQIVQTNWKPALNWESSEGRESVVQKIFNSAKELIPELFKKNGLQQFLLQAELDCIGYNFDKMKVFAVEVAFHNGGLNYGEKNETRRRVLSKILRAAMCVKCYFDPEDADIIFASPKTNPLISGYMLEVEKEAEKILKACGLNYSIKVLQNEEFSNEIYVPVKQIAISYSDTAELFLRTIQISSICEQERGVKTLRNNFEKVLNNDEYSNMKVGEIARKILIPILQSDSISDNVLEMLQTNEYSKKMFDLQYPLLLDGNKTNSSPARYYSTPIFIKGKKYYVCSEWFESISNNDRPYLIEWVNNHKTNNTTENSNEAENIQDINTNKDKVLEIKTLKYNKNKYKKCPECEVNYIEAEEDICGPCKDKKLANNRMFFIFSLEEKKHFDEFEIYLIKNGYSQYSPSGRPSTVYEYLNSLKNVCLRENISLNKLVNTIRETVRKYDFGGSEYEYGIKGNKTVINALKAFERFCCYTNGNK